MRPVVGTTAWALSRVWFAFVRCLDDLLLDRDQPRRWTP